MQSNSKHPKIFVFHYLSVEAYPPALNTIEILQAERLSFRVVTTSIRNPQFNLINQEYITRYFYKKDNLYYRLLTYLIFNLSGLLLLLRYRPQKILYYDTLSCFPPLIYKYLFPSAEIFMHHHEYVSKPEIITYSLYYRILNALEKKSLKLLTWKSQTNQDRANLFQRDYPEIDPGEILVWPNYPLSNWRQKRLNSASKALKIIYIGSISLENSYLSMFLDWMDDKGNVFLDIYSQNMTHETLKRIGLVKNVKFKGVTDYKELRTILPEYDVGIVFYIPKTANVRYVIPNKVIEYLVCGLDVWCPFEIETTYQWALTNSYIAGNSNHPPFFFCIQQNRVDTSALTAESVFPYHLFALELGSKG